MTYSELDYITGVAGACGSGASTTAVYIARHCWLMKHGEPGATLAVNSRVVGDAWYALEKVLVEQGQVTVADVKKVVRDQFGGTN